MRTEWIVSLALLALVGCKHEKPNFIYMPDMVYSPAFKAQEEGAMRMPVPGTVSRNFESYPNFVDAVAAGRELKNPLRATAGVLARGQQMYNVHCIVCHGPNGEGDGPVAPKFGRPPSLQSDKLRGFADGSIFHIITMGQNLMPSYATQVAASDRWSIILYIRALQRAKHPSPEDLRAARGE